MTKKQFCSSWRNTIHKEEFLFVTMHCYLKRSIPVVHDTIPFTREAFVLFMTHFLLFVMQHNSQRSTPVVHNTIIDKEAFLQIMTQYNFTKKHLCCSWCDIIDKASVKRQLLYWMMREEEANSKSMLSEVINTSCHNYCLFHCV